MTKKRRRRKPEQIVRLLQEGEAAMRLVKGTAFVRFDQTPVAKLNNEISIKVNVIRGDGKCVCP